MSATQTVTTHRRTRHSRLRDVYRSRAKSEEERRMIGEWMSHAERM